MTEGFVRCSDCNGLVPDIAKYCWYCGMEFEEEEEEEEEEEGEVQKVTRIKCPKCGSPIRITSEKRPLEITCDNCGARGRLR